MGGAFRRARCRTDARHHRPPALEPGARRRLLDAGGSRDARAHQAGDVRRRPSVTTAQWITILAIGLPALLIVLWPLLGARSRSTQASPRFDDRLELEEAKAAIYQALAELDFDHETGSLSDDDYRSLRGRYEGRAAEVIARLDAMGPVTMPPGAMPPGADAPLVGPRPWTRRPATIAVGALAMLALGIGLGVGISRYTTPADTMVPPESRLPVPMSPDPGPLLPGKSGAP